MPLESPVAQWQLDAQAGRAYLTLPERNELAMVGTIPSPEGEKIIALGAYYLDKKTNRAEVALVTLDDWQGKGLGTRMMTALMDAARIHRLTMMEGTVLRQNAAMLQMMRDLGFSVSRVPDDPDIVAVERWL